MTTRSSDQDSELIVIMLLLAGLSLSGFVAIFIFLFKYKQRQKNKRFRREKEYRAEQRQNDPRHNRNLYCENEINQTTHKCNDEEACDYTKHNAGDSDDVLIGQINDIVQETKTQNYDSLVPVLEETDEESSLCDKSGDMRYFSV